VEASFFFEKDDLAMKSDSKKKKGKKKSERGQGRLLKRLSKIHIPDRDGKWKKRAIIDL